MSEKTENRSKDLDLQSESDKEKNDASKETPTVTQLDDNPAGVDELQSNVVLVTYDRPGCVHEAYRLLSKNDQNDAEVIHESPETDTSASTPAKEFAYTLDPFQEAAIECLEKRESVLVSAHTSAGKTTVAEYAIAMGLRDSQKVIYTSPIKALSNQKLRDLSQFGDVGLLTGDVCVNPKAKVLVMTIEILRSMLYRGSDLIQQTKWVIFDEIHYMRDPERGVVWEESIILLPDAVRFVFLSATIPNSREFAEWVCRVKQQPCHVVYTDKRPVPLQHYVFPLGGNGLFQIIDEKKTFLEDNFIQASNAIGKGAEDFSTMSKTRVQKASSTNQDDIKSLVDMLCSTERQFTPVIVFAFSKREVESNGRAMKDSDFTTPEQKKIIDVIMENAVKSLPEEDRQLPQIKAICDMLRRGIGIHHGGLLPLVKEIVEICFQEELMKVLFSTETFSMGINMPAKTVVFAKIRKWDGRNYRLLTAGEYVQMSGRAGRRGIDSRGVSIVMLDEKLEAADAKELFLGQPNKIESAFHLSYNMILNIMRIEGVNPQYLIARSFGQFQRNKQSIELRKEQLELETELQKSVDLTYCLNPYEKEETIIPSDINETVQEYFALSYDIKTLKTELHRLILKVDHVSRFLQNGRVLRIKFNDVDYGWGVLVSITKKRHKVQSSRNAELILMDEEAESSDLLLDVALKVDPESAKGLVYSADGVVKSPSPATNGGAWRIVACSLLAVYEFSEAVVKGSYSNIQEIRRNRSNFEYRMDSTVRQIEEAKVSTLHPIHDMKIQDPDLLRLMKKIESLENKVESSFLHRHPLKEKLLNAHQDRVRLLTKSRQIKSQLESNQYYVLHEELRMMKKALKKMKYITGEGNTLVVTQKGTVASEITAGDEIVVTELLMDKVLDDLPSDVMIAALSCFSYDEKSSASEIGALDLRAAHDQIVSTAEKVAKVFVECKLKVDVNEFSKKFPPDVMDATRKWYQGSKFQDIVGRDMFEGSLVRALRSSANFFNSSG
eukprot:GHVP01018900.1.p1 GENE.GHVP01018900.1~~GHVP01018900.1.p1  ORF type:complete len:1072 (+),score=214.99 GHVP01018900.1:196-3216(+)